MAVNYYFFGCIAQFPPKDGPASGGGYLPAGRQGALSLDDFIF